jgi:hypothetical protein
VSKWGVFCDPNTGHIHVAPCDKDGRPFPPHTLIDDCDCSPRQDTEEPGLKVHRDPERGGTDA